MALTLLLKVLLLSDVQNVKVKFCGRTVVPNLVARAASRSWEVRQLNRKCSHGLRCNRHLTMALVLKVHLDGVVVEEEVEAVEADPEEDNGIEFFDFVLSY